MWAHYLAQSCRGLHVVTLRQAVVCRGLAAHPAHPHRTQKINTANHATMSRGYPLSVGRYSEDDNELNMISTRPPGSSCEAGKARDQTTHQPVSDALHSRLDHALTSIVAHGRRNEASMALLVAHC